MPAATKVYEGSCLCKKVRYRVNGPLGSISNCYCTDCRKTHAAAFATYIDIKRKDLTWVAGEKEMTAYRAEPGTMRAFCRTCGSTLACWAESDKEQMEISASTVDTPFDGKIEYHIFVRSKPSWYDILDGRPQHQAYPQA
jgi:hypothetical protein